MMTDEETESRKPTKANIQAAINGLKDIADEGDRIIVYFTGHTLTVDDIPTLCPMDFNMKKGASTGLTLNELAVSLGNCKAAARLILIDAMPFSGLVDRNKLLTLPPRTAILCAAKPGFRAFDSTKYKTGFFTYHLSKGLSGEADRQGNSNGKVDLSELYLYTKSRLFEGNDDDPWPGPMVPGLILSNDIDDLFNHEFANGTKTRVPQAQDNYVGR